MSDQRRRDVAKNADPPSDEDEDNLESGNGISVSNLNYTVEELGNGELECFEAGSVEVKETDVLTIEDITDHPCFEQSDGENPADKVMHEFPTELYEENCNQLSQTYFDNSDNFCNQEKADECDIKDAHLSSCIKEKQENKILKKKNKEDIVSESDWKTDQAISTKSNVKNKEYPKEWKASSLQIHSQRCPNIKISAFNCLCDDSELSSIKERFKCPEHSSDEFADFEDSSASDGVEDSSEQKTEKTASMKRIKSNQGNNVACKSGSKSTLIPATSLSGSENNIQASNSDGKNSRCASKKNHESSDICFSQGKAKRIKSTPGNDSAEGKNNFKYAISPIAELPGKLDGENSPSTSYKRNFQFSQGNSIKIKTVTSAKKAHLAGTKNKLRGEMSTIVEVPEENEASSSSIPPYSKPNPLKMKSKVGYKKDRCYVCKVRLGLCAIKCRCGGYYCAKHRYDKEHDCAFDYKAMGAEEIRKNNPKIIAEKVRKL